MPVAARVRRVATPPVAAISQITLAIGAFAVALRTDDRAFLTMVEERYTGFVSHTALPHFTFDVHILRNGRPRLVSADDDIRVVRESRGWRVERGDFSAGWDNQTRHGWLEQTVNPYALDTLLRIAHSIELAENGGFLLHAASAVRNGRAFLFSGLSGAGKTTLSRLAPPDAHVLTDEISYLTDHSGAFHAHGTPFAGELARVGENISAPVAALCLLEKAPRNYLEEADATAVFRALMRNVLFLTNDNELVHYIFQSCVDFVAKVPAYRMHFTPDARAWELIR